ncbi:Uncharacterised protein [Yersinia aldovae]|uniref:StbB family protein n=1 Tax=Yersinia aldovae TaxID=29483 RepID=UPI0005DF5D7A|nr:StbB family protein [Yersinia aldovae]CNK26161.1 Uncharacterised protein [Yersinia aldovae]
MFLKIAVVNNSGNVGKTTICESLLKPRLDGAEIIKVESINSDGTDDEKFTAAQFVEIFKRIDGADCAIVDVGSSNIEQFMNQLTAYKGSQEDFDYFIIPVVPKYKQQVDTITTIENLLDLNVEADRIRLVFNMVENDINFEKQFSEILESKTYKSLKLKKTPIVPSSEVFAHLSNAGKSFKEVTEDTSDYRALLRQTESKEEREKLSEARSIKRIVNGMNESLDVAFKDLNII